MGKEKIETVSEDCLKVEPCIFTDEELIEQAKIAEESFEAGLGIPHEEMKKRHAG